ncbi:MAG: hypothetical protein EXS30_04790 [Pedosphaera sp.]|nr:hypothetical protein [Pedosphaera sp.]
MSELIWIRSKWKLEDIHSESVEFKLPVQDGEAHGVGQFVASRNPEGLLSIDIRTILRGDNPNERGTFNFHVSQWAADRIERHPNSAVAKFRCFG